MIEGDTWLAATTKSLEELADIYFDSTEMEEVEFSDKAGNKSGAMVGLVSQNNTVQLMLVASKRGSEILSKTLLGFEAAHEITQSDLADAMAEIVNIVAGMVKSVVNEQDGDLHLTLPTFLTGDCQPLGQFVTEGHLKLGSVETKVIVVHGIPQETSHSQVSAA